MKRNLNLRFQFPVQPNYNVDSLQQRQQKAWLVAGFSVAVAGLISACGVPLDRADRPLRKDELGYKPVREIPATTTTTSTTTTTIVTPSSVPETTTPPPSTALVPLVYPLDVYWIDPFGQIVPARRTQEGNDLANAITALRYPPLSFGPESGLRSAIVDSTMIVDAKLAGGIATIELGSEFLNLPGPEQSLAIAQIVFTVTAVPAGIGRVRFRVNGRPIAVPLANGQPTTGSVSRDDYTSLLGPLATVVDSSAVLDASTTSTTSTTTTDSAANSTVKTTTTSTSRNVSPPTDLRPG
jgi:Sporulation and spore germination